MQQNWPLLILWVLINIYLCVISTTNNVQNISIYPKKSPLATLQPIPFPTPTAGPKQPLIWLSVILILPFLKFNINEIVHSLLSLASSRFFSEYKTKHISNRSAKSEERWLKLKHFISASLKKYFWRPWQMDYCTVFREHRDEGRYKKVRVQIGP